jgi:phosphatidylglycerophosphatase A
VRSIISPDPPPAAPAGAPSLAFLLRHPAHWIALGFGTGLAPVAPGTFGSLLALPLAWVLDRHAGTGGWVTAIVVVTALGTWGAHVTSRDLGVADHRSIVSDEIAAFLLVLFFVGPDWWRQAIAFVLFRFFDIVKPPPIRQVDRAMKNAVGVMADDFLAAAYTLLAFAIGQRLFGVE